MPAEKRMNIRKAEEKDRCRIAEIFVFNNRVSYYPIFQDEQFSFRDLTVQAVLEDFREHIGDLSKTWVYDDGILRGFMETEGEELHKLYVDPFFQKRGIGAEMLAEALETLGVRWLWVIEPNRAAVRFYRRYGFHDTGERDVCSGEIRVMKMAR